MVSDVARSSRTCWVNPWRAPRVKARGGRRSDTWIPRGLLGHLHASGGKFHLGASMRVLYGVVGEGMGHATRSRVTLEHLLTRDHEVRVVVSGRAHKFLVERFAGRKNITFEEIHGLHLKFEGNDLALTESLLANLG